jgi:hypothetical protein
MNLARGALAKLPPSLYYEGRFQSYKRPKRSEVRLNPPALMSKGSTTCLKANPVRLLTWAPAGGPSVQEVIAVAREITQKAIPLKMASRRAGRPRPPHS